MTAQPRNLAVLQQIKVDVTRDLDNAKTRRTVARNFISDTVTAPTEEMYQYALGASVGDDVWRNEISTNLLESQLATLTGKEAGIFLTSGTLSNQIALRTHLHQPPYSVLCDDRAHINKYEASGAAFHSGAQVIAVKPANGHHITLDDVKQNYIAGTDIHIAPTRVIALENTLNGTIIPQEDILAISAFAREEGISMHLDGARLWHVVAETGLSLEELCSPFDSVALCFSKGLGAPFGSILVGRADFIAKARWFRKLFGAGMRQTGFLAASAAYAVSNHVQLLPGVHDLTRKLEKGFADMGIRITSHAETCMFFFDPSPVGFTFAELSERAAQLPEPILISGSRIVLHIQTSPEAVSDLIDLATKLVEEKRAAGFIKPTQSLAQPTGNIYVRSGIKAAA